MKLTNEAKRDILDFVLGRVAAIADIEYQKRVWIRGEGSVIDDFDETACHFLHEGAGILEKYKDFEITETQYQQLKKFRDEFKVFSDKHTWPHKFIETPEWEKITEMAKDVLKSFNYSKTAS
jgi:hypothetical protein